MIQQPNGDKNLIDLVKILWQWKWRILSLVLLATILSMVISLLLPNYFKSSAIFYAASQDLAKPQPIGDSERIVNYFGNDNDIDRLLTLAHSHKLKTFLIDSFDLYSHYEIDRDSRNAQHKLREKLEKLLSIEKTKFGAISLSIEDFSPEKAFEMTTAASNFVDQSVSNQWKNSQSKLLETYNRKIQESDAKIMIVNDSLREMKQAYNIYDLTNQSEIFLTQQTALQSRELMIKSKLGSSTIQNNPDSLSLYSSLQSGIQSQLSRINSRISQFNEGLNPITTLERLQIQMTRQIAIDKERRDQLLASYHSSTAGIILVEEPEVAIYKSRPRRSLYVLGTIFLSLVLTSLFAILFSTYQKNDWSFLKE